MRIAIFVSFCFAASPLFAQQKVPPSMAYHRVYAVTPLVGSGSANDPKRPVFAPVVAPAAGDRSGIIGYQMQLSDDGNFALVEFVFESPAAFQNVLAKEATARGIAVTPALESALPGQPSGLQTALQTAVPGLTIFERGKATDAQILAAFQQYKKTFTFAGTTVRPQ